MREEEGEIGGGYELSYRAETCTGRLNRIKYVWLYTGSVNKTPPEKEKKIDTSQAEPLAANSRAVGQFLSISYEMFR